MAFDQASEHGWIVLKEGQAYSKTITFNREIFLLVEDDDSWTIWWGWWPDGGRYPRRQKTLAEGMSFLAALERADNYVEWYTKHRKKGRGK